MKLQARLQDWTVRADAFLAKHNLTRADITTGRDAWSVASGAGLAREAYDISPDVVDAHIQTALQAIFPNATFRDARRLSL